MSPPARRLCAQRDRQPAAELLLEIGDNLINRKDLSRLLVHTGIDIDHEGADRLSGRQADHRFGESPPPSSDGSLVRGGMLKTSAAAITFRCQGPFVAGMAGKDRPVVPGIIKRRRQYGGSGILDFATRGGHHAARSTTGEAA